MSFTLERFAREQDSAAVMGSGAVHVFGTPAMILLMEEAAAACVQGELPEGSATVGTMVNIRHLSATPIGAKVSAKARLVGIDGRFLEFVVEAHDENGLIGDGTHQRAVIDVARFMSKFDK